MKRFAIIHKDDTLSLERKNQIQSALEKCMIYDEKHPELVISIGGDGTMLDAVHQYISMLDDVFFVGVHTGTLGFFTDYNEDEWETLVKDILNNQYIVDPQCVLKIETEHDTYFALNEMRLEENHRTLICDVYINDELLERFRGNGLCISTPSGSTALNRSLGGSVIASSISSMQLSEIAGIHHNAYRSLQSSLVLDASSSFTLDPKQSQGMILGIDRDVIPFNETVGKIKITMAKRQVQFVRYRHRGLCQRLRKAFISE